MDRGDQRPGADVRAAGGRGPQGRDQVTKPFHGEPSVIRTLPVVAAAILFIAASSAAAEPPAKPNVVIVFADDMGYGDLACYGNKVNKSPNLDRMAREGTRFTDFYVAQ